jgi:mono/diheme cytochrome c family protein
MRKALWFLVAAGLTLPAQPSVAADPAQGRQLAARWCASCHAIGAGPAQTLADKPPSFASVAARPDFDTNRLAFFLLNPHPVMPNMSLSRIEAADLAAYISSLR